jgi:hypothetical protein
MELGFGKRYRMGKVAFEHAASTCLGHVPLCPVYLVQNLFGSYSSIAVGK